MKELRANLSEIRLSPKQREVVQHQDGALLVVAGPGSGKTRVLTERARRLLTESEGHFRILALTFTNKAANEMRERLAEFPDINQRAFIGTLHSFCLQVLSERGKSVGVESVPHLFEQTSDRREMLVQAIKEDPLLMDELRMAGDSRNQSTKINGWLETIARLKRSFVLPEVVDDQVTRRVYESYNASLRVSNGLDFDDLLLLTYRLFEERPKIAGFYRRLYRYVCIDEAQDLNEAQYKVILALCGPEYRNVMMVGDPKQAIYEFNAASPKYLARFQRDFQAKRIELNENFRSSKAVVNAARALVPQYEVNGQLPVEGSIDLIVGEDEDNEASRVATELQKILSSGHPDIEGELTFERCAILGRTRYVLVHIEDHLQRVGVPYYKQLSPNHESESELARQFETCLRLVANPRDQIHMNTLLSGWGKANSVSQSDGIHGLNDLVRVLEDLASDDVHRAIIEAISILGSGFTFSRGLDRLEQYAMHLGDEDEQALVLQDIRVWRRHWDVFVRGNPSGSQGAAAFLSQVALGATQQSQREGVALLTVHSAKGLEFDVVFIMGMAEKVFPDYRARDERSLAEEQRNAFVAITRSKRILRLSFPKKRIMPWGDSRLQQPSRYLRMMGLV